MEDAIFSPGTIVRAFSDSSIDFDLVDDLLIGGCWLESTQGSDFLLPSTSNSAAVFDSSSLTFSSSDADIRRLATDLTDFNQVDKDKSVVLDVYPPFGSQQKSLALDRSTNERTDCMVREGSCATKYGEVICSDSVLGTRWWIEPQENSGEISSVKERLIKAVNYIKDSAREGDVLIQIWVPIKKEGRNVLITSGQPYWHDPSCQRLVNYRTISTNFQFSAEENSNEAAGLPGRVFLGKLPEWTPDVRYFTCDEYPRVGHAQRNGVQGSLALPVFENGNGACLGVVELIMTTQKVNYQPELESICNALQAVNLRSSELPSLSCVQEAKKPFQVAIPEILDVLKAVCETHRLPLAQTWVPCIQQGKRGSRHSDENYKNCVSTVDVACYVTDPHMWGFHVACSEHHLFRGQGVAGKAFTTNQPCFSGDITSFSKFEYPLSHYAKMFGLRAAVAIRLRSICTGFLDYVLEFFLPVHCIDSDRQKLMLNSLSVTIQQVCQTLRVVTDKEVEEDPILHGNQLLASGGTLSKISTSIGDLTREVPSWLSSYQQSRDEGKVIADTMTLDVQKQESSITTHCDPVQYHADCTEENFKVRTSPFVQHEVSSGAKFAERKKTKSEKNISLQVLKQYFAGSLKDAAKSIGVCPTTLKRICRQHGISRWPSRKIKKVGHSLQKIQLILDSVQGVEGSFQIPSIYDSFPKAYGSKSLSPELPGSTNSSGIKQQELPEIVDTSILQEILKTDGLTASQSPPSSCSQSTSSSVSCSSNSQQHHHFLPSIASADAIMDSNQDSSFKRAYSEADLNLVVKEELKPPVRSLSRKPFDEEPCVLGVSFLLESVNRPSRDEVFRVKVACGDEKVRFSLHPSWGFQDLKQEIGKRFLVKDMNMFDLKYLDDDSEWVLLTCDADLEECKDICRSSGARAIKLSVHIKKLNTSYSLDSVSGVS